MKQSMLKAVFFASILLVATSCNDDDDDNGGGTTQPSFSFKGNTVDLTTYETVEWSATSVIAEVSFFGNLSVKAIKGTDTLSILVPSIDEGFYPIESNSLLGFGNYFVEVNPSDTVFFRLDGTADTGGLLTITVLDTINKTFDGEFTTFYTNPDSAELFFSFQEGMLLNIPYTEETFDFGGFGDGTMAFSANGQNYSFDDAVGESENGILELSAFQFPNLAPGVNLTMNEDITAGTYSIGTAADAISGSITLNDFFDIYTSTTGSLTITSNDVVNGNIVGSFSFSAVSISDPTVTVSVTAGSFDVDY
jgi:hypothetical protein